MAYINISEEWGDEVEVTVQDYMDQALKFGAPLRLDDIDVREDGLYINARRVAEPMPESK